MKLKLLFVDDRSKRIHSALVKYGDDFDVRIAPSVKETLRLISAENWDIVSLDHDLNGEDFQNPDERTCGMEIVRHVVHYGWPWPVKPVFVVHTKNIFSGHVMTQALRDAGYYASYVPYNYDESVIEWMPFYTRTNEPLPKP